MNLDSYTLLAFLIIIIGIIILIFVILLFSRYSALKEEIKELQQNLDKLPEKINSDLTSQLSVFDNNNSQKITHLSSSIKQAIEMLADYTYKGQKQTAEYHASQLESIHQTLHNNALMEETKLENIRSTVETNLSSIREDNNNKLEEMRKTVDEKLQETLQSRLSASFQLVSQQLEAVHQGLGEMQNLATGVGDLKKVLSNVKTRGILGEIQLSAILKDILNESQYEENINTIPNSSQRVEFAIRLPNGEDGIIYLPIDSKFPAETYIALTDALENGNKEQIDICRKALVSTLKKEAKDIKEKYVQTPYTTEFAVLFVPTEGLYCEAINSGMLETLQKEYKITICGPSTMAALLNSLQMGFKTLAIQQRSSEVWNLLGSVKSEFDKFETTLNAAQTRIQQTSDELDKLVGTRTRAINKQLRNVQSNSTPLENYGNISVLENKEG